ncbi:GNAT family N-acetyltransferase [Bacillus sp. AFS015802]|uniref:GNAT family N-acetyltransferase n=1 Tax=Bacillus sp. AFS015802 TaxID=2033486 RepID=UPI000BF6CB24|nr:GNAT family N-acetyltransferase [Bacillus sp. AFS015802]PFA69251.1 GNAT family N-acetyltransferase [Bacillus sp. AFS015802]
MEEIVSRCIHPDIKTLLSFATSHVKVNEEYASYLHSNRRKLFGFRRGEGIVACIGVEFLEDGRCEIKLVAVMPGHRGAGVGKKMLDNTIQNYSISSMVAETDRDAVLFYKKIGFEVESLGEKYPGVERFRCERIWEG